MRGNHRELRGFEYAVLWGLLVWKEFAGAAPPVRRLLAIMLVLFVLGLEGQLSGYAV